jgi:hypothetical protein
VRRIETWHGTWPLIDEAELLGNGDPLANLYHEASHVVVARELGAFDAYLAKVDGDPEFYGRAVFYPYLNARHLTRGGKLYLCVTVAGLLGQAVFVARPELGRRSALLARMFDRTAELGWTPSGQTDAINFIVTDFFNATDYDGPVAVDSLGEDAVIFDLLAPYGRDEALRLLLAAEDRAVDILTREWNCVVELAEEFLTRP